MTGAADPARVPLWRRRRPQLAAVALLVLAAWAYQYLEALPVARPVAEEDARAFAAGADRALRIGGLAAGRVMAFRTAAARRLVLSLPARAKMLSPDPPAFQARAKLEAAALAGASYGADQILVDAHPGPNENAMVTLELVGGPGTDGALRLQKAEAPRYQNGLRLAGEGRALKLTIDFTRSRPTPPVGRMILSDKGDVATLGHAEFQVAPGDPIVAEFLEPAAAGGDSAIFDFVAGDAGLAASSVAAGPARTAFAPDRIACAATRNWLWWKVVPEVALSDCGPAALQVTGFDLAGGQLAFAGDKAFFKGVKDEDDARLVTRASANMIVKLVVAALLGSALVPWALAQFRGGGQDKAPAPSPPRPDPTARVRKPWRRRGS